MPHSLPQRSGGFRDYEKDAPITVFGCMQARLVGECPGIDPGYFSQRLIQGVCQHTALGFPISTVFPQFKRDLLCNH